MSDGYNNGKVPAEVRLPTYIIVGWLRSGEEQETLSTLPNKKEGAQDALSLKSKRKTEDENSWPHMVFYRQ
jgi:hypothetical protein